MDSKHWSQSKTIWFNALLAALTVLCSNVELLRASLSDGMYLWVSVGAAAVNVWLRTQTSVPLAGGR